jgi:gamma-glutamyltranspeptidase/glutathione hydrolase
VNARCALLPVGFALFAATGHAATPHQVSGQVGDAQGAPIITYNAINHPVVGRHGMVASQDAEATRVGVEILRRGGNAIDVAVGVGLALAVTLPRAGNLRGGGFLPIPFRQLSLDASQVVDHRRGAALPRGKYE